ncbi:carbonic anhydrase [Synechococcus elongatus]|uniref:carbonic anhydrase n=1 Tax=Synechococcus elongatus PCC 11801 TaxID=2219813 RepID=A0AAQ3MCB0_SYNEL
MRRRSLLAALGGSCVGWLGSSQPVWASAEWDYGRRRGPRRWAQLDPAYGLCKQGRQQSPINLQGQPSTVALDYRDRPFKGILQSAPHSLRIDCPSGCGCWEDGVFYELLQFHFHTPSEHYRQGRRFPAEIHLVHRSDRGQLAVIAVFLAPGDRLHPELQAILAMPKRSSSQQLTTDLQPSVFLPRDRTVWRYSGSLTTPPCSEPVLWRVCDRPLLIARSQLRQLRQRLGVNARPLPA